MISYEDLCAALERYVARTRGDVVGHEQAPPDAPTAEHAMPPVGNMDDTGQQQVYDDTSNEIDLGDVVSDEESPKN